MKYPLIAWLGLVLSAATGALADCGSYTNCLECVRANCAYSDAICYDSCDEVTAANDCFAFENYVGVDSAEQLCAIAGVTVPPQAPPTYDIPNIGGSATIGEEEEKEEGDDCPTPSGDGFCTTDYTPVVCGNNCEYSNACNAGAAGFEPETDCVLVNGEAEVTTECPPMGEGMCTMEYLPVLCGESNCEYSNSCNAALAGFSPTDCTLKEPAEPESTEPIAITIPSELHLTYFTGLDSDLDLDLSAEEYDEIAGHIHSFYRAAFQEDPDFSGDFVSLSTTTTETTYTSGGSPNVVIKFDANYVFSAGSTVTADQVVQKMESADYVDLILNYLHSKPPENQLDRVQLVEFLTFAGTAETSQCPPVGEGMCTMEYMPIVCGDDNCKYDNGCNAELAGFNPDTECILMEDTGDMMTEHEMGNMTTMDSACSMLPTCESCLNARIKGCVWTAGMCSEECIADASCWSPSIQGGNMTGPELCEMAADDIGEIDFMGENVTDSPCSMLPTCESCLNARLKGCVWTAGMCSEDCVADASCWAPFIQGENMTGPELCAMAEEDLPADEVDVTASRTNVINAAQAEAEEEAAASSAAVVVVVVQHGILAVVASIFALSVLV